MATEITGSPNITSLDSKIVADLCAGYFYVDVTPSVFTAEGILTSGGVQGASVKITNPLGIVIKQYATSGFDIYPPMTSIVSVLIPTVAGVYQYGTYTIDVTLTDEDGTQYTISKSVNICPPDPNNKNRNYGCMNIAINGNCKTGYVVFLLDNPPNYKGTTFTSQVNALTVKYPTESGKTDLSTAIGAFSILLYEGQYQVSGTVCALYTYGDNVFFKINYKVKCEKIIKCIIDECCVFAKFEELNLKLISDCTQEQKDATSSTILDAMRLLKTAELAADCGKDPSDYISQLESLLGCICTCNCNEGVPIIGSDTVSTILGGFLYRGIVSQTSTNAPTAVASADNVVEITWTRSSDGLYIGTLSGTYTPLTAANCFLLTNISSLESSVGHIVECGYNSADSIYIRTDGDSQLNNNSIQLSIL